VLFEVTCPCGRGVRGERRPRAQVLTCLGCRRPLFVLPVSPWAELAASAARSRLRAWRAPLLAGAGCVALLIGLFLVALPYLPRRTADPVTASTASLPARIAAARSALGNGSFHLAQREFDSAVAAHERQPGQLTAEQARDLVQLQRQADLLARLCPRSLQEILRQASLVRDPDEWRAQFNDYKGRTVLFEDVVARDPDGRAFLTGYVVEVNGETARVALDDLTLLRNLPLDPPRRLLFGARLASCGRAAGGGWVVHFEPASAVLLTDIGAVTYCLPGPFSGELRETLRRQRHWVRELPALKPTR
jgi:hypothetical protein